MSRGFVVENNRNIKAKKIEAVCSDYLVRPIKNMKILDIGAGTGYISQYFAQKNDVTALDVVEQIKVKDRKFKFVKNDTKKLPFENGTFDIVIFNHVVEHLDFQEEYMNEINRVLKDDGICYFATPNRFFIKEVHYKVYFLHYLNTKTFHNLMRKRGKYSEDIYLLTYPQMKKLIKKSNFEYKEYTSIVTKDKEKFYFDSKWIVVPEMLKCVSSTNIFVLCKK